MRLRRFRRFRGRASASAPTFASMSAPTFASTSAPSPPRAAPPQLALPVDLRRLTRAGAPAKKLGRPPTGRRRDPRHRPRPPISRQHPQHVVLVTTDPVGSLRKRHAYRAIRGALTRQLARGDFRVVHVSIQANHVHLLVEADHKRALARGMQGFAISAAKRLNRELGRRRGDVFAYRYHATSIETPTQARNALSYVLNNWRHHRADARAPWHIDPFSSADAFDGWQRPHHEPPPRLPLLTQAPRTWLLAQGYRRAGPIRWDEVPGADSTPP